MTTPNVPNAGCAINPRTGFVFTCRKGERHPLGTMLATAIPNERVERIKFALRAGIEACELEGMSETPAQMKAILAELGE